MEKRKRPPLPLDASPQEKYDNLILTFYGLWQEIPGSAYSSSRPTSSDKIDELGFTNENELRVYVKQLVSNGLLYNVGAKEDAVYGLTPRVGISVNGLNYCHSLLESGKNSIRCFVAMKFSGDMVQFL
jgi:hypothetical protein